jgi:diguanylate cyclase (GGDEF)-like protein/PAS domain S-box-containing protein
MDNADPLPDTDFDRLTRLLAHICETPVAAVMLVDARRQWFESSVGLDIGERGHAIAFCAQAMQATDLLIEPDALANPELASDPLVIGEPGIRFYAGVRLVSPEGIALGTMAVMDRLPRALGAAQVEALATLGGQATALLELRRQRRLFQNAASENAERLKHLSNATADALWDWNLETDGIRWNQGLQTLFGVPLPDVGSDSDSWTGRLHPDDKNRVLHRIHEVIDGQEETWRDEYRFMRQDRTYAYVIDRGFVIRDDKGRAVRMVGGMSDHTARKQSELERDKLHKENIQLLEYTGEGIWGIDRNGRCSFANAAAARMLGYEVHELLGKDMHELTHHHHANGACYPAEECPIFVAARTGHTCHRDDEVFWRKDHSAFSVKYVCYPILDGGAVVGSVVTFSDITEARLAKLEIMRINRALQMRSACHELLIRATDEKGLLTDVCRLARDFGGYRVAWAGFAQDDELRSIAPVAHAGDAVAEAYLAGLAVSWCEQQPSGRGPGGETIRTGMPVVVEDLKLAHPDIPGLAKVREHGYRGLVCLPLRDSQRTFGLLALFSDEARPIPAEEIKLLQALADDLAFGIDNLRAQDERRRLQSVVSKVAAGVSASSGTRFFEQLARHMAEAVGAHVAFIARWRQGEPSIPSPVVAVVDGTVDTRFDDVIEGLPWQRLFAEQAFVVHAGGAGQPGCPALLEAFDAEGYVGGRLDNSDGEPVGLLFVCFRDRLKRTEFITSTLQIFAARIAAELERQAAESEIQRLALHDPLTRLPNRQLLLDRMQHALAICARTRSAGALLLIDLDNFKTLNETLGHATGDQLLQQVAARLAKGVRNSDTVARLGGDEFVVMLEDLGQGSAEAAARARGVGEEILAALNLPYQLAGRPRFSSPSIGITLFHQEDADVSELLKRADLAMYQAKAAGRNTLRFFDPDMQKAVAERAALEADFRQGLQNEEFLLHYQPQVDREGYPTGAEALVRWRHPRRGLVSPAEFIPLAEETGLILPLGQWVLESACQQMAIWAARPDTASLTMAVNVSARQFRHPDFVAQVLAVLERTGADPRQLKLELTEGSLIEDFETTIAKMIVLKAQGVGFSLDDFGTGYSSLAYLKRLPLDQLKIDQSFVRDVLTDANDSTIARTIVALGQSLGLAVIAEGVETEAQRDFLARHNCDAFQGYLFSRPLPPDQFDAFIRARDARPLANQPATVEGVSANDTYAAS